MQAIPRVHRRALKGKCAIVSSYKPDAGAISKEDAGAGQTELLARYEIYRRMLFDHFGEPADKVAGRVDEFEKEVKKWFVEQPDRMRLLIVVDKLLTGFDAPPATYLYIDKSLRDHGLFQAVCRVNRLDGEDKDYGYIVDYRDLFKSLEKAVEDYTGEAFDDYDDEDVAGLLSDRVTQAAKDLDEALDIVRALCDPVAMPKDTNAYLAYFCGDPDDPEALSITEPRRVELYKFVASLARRYAAVASDMPDAGYSAVEAAQIKAEVDHYVAAEQEVAIGSGDYVDLKCYEPGMRALLDKFVDAKESTVVSTIGDDAEGVVELLARLGGEGTGVIVEHQGGSEAAAAATIVNNVRRLIVDERQTNPKFYDRMSELLSALIAQQKQEAADYKANLVKLATLAAQVHKGEHSDNAYPEWADNGARRALIDFGLPKDLARAVDQAVLSSKPADWIGNVRKGRRVRAAIAAAVSGTLQEDDRLEELIDLIRNRSEYA